jgi:DNA-binding winged helix-turn-helix (wHTH) protein/tetratricopeptide (TPR) repeat protein
MWLFQPFRLDVANQCLWRGETRVPLMPKPFAVLQYLVEHAGRLVTQDELLAAIWPDTHVQPDVLRRYILEIRRVLEDQAETPRFIETLTKRGYRFVAQVTAERPPARVNETSTPAASSRSRTVLAATAILAIGVLLGAGFLWHSRQARPLPEKGTIVLGDFINRTGDRVFDGTLRQGLAVQLEQSPFLSLVSEEQIQQTLRLMKQPPDAKLTPEVERGACQRTGGTIFLEGSIAQIGARYSLILRAVNCTNGESITSTEAQAIDKSHVLEALGKASSDIREKLGESLATIQRFDTPLVQATTPSLEALQAYSLAYKEAVGKGDSGSAIPLLQRAIRLDPNFAMAYSTLGLSYWNLGENILASENIHKAFDLRAGVSEWEKLRIEAEYYSLVTNNLEKARRAYEVWAQTYVRDWVPRNLLGAVHTALGQYEEALIQYREALRLYPQSGLLQGNLVLALIALNRFEEARAVADEAMTKHPDSPGLRVGRYRLAFLQNDQKGMEQQLDFSAGRSGLEDELLWNEAATAAYFGQIEKARRFYRQAVASAQRAEEIEAAAGYEADAALKEALFGNKAAAQQGVESACRLSTGPDVQYKAALALVLAGDRSRAQSLTEDLAKHFPEDTIVQSIYLPTVRAQLALDRNDTLKAIEDLDLAPSYQFGALLYPAYVRGLAYLAAHRESEAVAEFQNILDKRGIVLNSPIGALAHLQIARAFTMRGDMSKARSEYQDLLALWKDADPDVPVLQQAKMELAKLNR